MESLLSLRASLPWRAPRSGALTLAAFILIAHLPQAGGGSTQPDSSGIDESIFEEGPLVQEGPEPDLIFLYTGRVRGFVEPCGCPRNPAGGLARRAGYLDLLRRAYPRAPFVLAETGDFAAGYDDAGRVKTSTYLEGLRDLGYDAVGAGESELSGGAEAWEEMLGRNPLEVISGSFTRRGSADLYLKPWVVKEYELKGGRSLRVGFIGLSSYNSVFASPGGAGATLVMRDPVEQARRLLHQVDGESDFVVLLANLSPREVKQVVEAAPGTIDLVLASYSDRLSPRSLEDIGGVPTLYAGDQGRRLGEVRLFQDEAGVRTMTGHRVHLTSRYPQVNRYQRMIDGMLARVNKIMKEGGGGEERGAQSAAGLAQAALPAAQGYLGSNACLACHNGAYQVWEHSGHAHAMRTLVDANQDFNPECVRCHTTGFGSPEGFRTAGSTPNLANVQCEACHGIGAAHVKETSAPYGSVPPRVCFTCHTRENSPDFSFFKYWKIIEH